MFLAVITTSFRYISSDFAFKIGKTMDTFVFRGEMSSSTKVSSNAGFERAVSFASNQSNFLVSVQYVIHTS